MTSNEGGLNLITDTFCTPNTTENCGHGICNAEGNYCFCEPGYVHDNTQFMFPNCYLSQTTFTAVISTLCVIALIIAVAAGFVMRGTTNMPKLICGYVIVMMLLLIAHLVSLILEGKPGIATEIFLVLLDTIGGSSAPMLMIYILISPAMELMMLHSQLLVAQKRMTLFVIGFFIEHVIVFTIALVFQYQGDYVTFNIIIASQFLFMSFYCALMYYMMRIYSRQLFSQMDKLLNSNIFVGDSPSPPQPQQHLSVKKPTKSTGGGINPGGDANNAAPSNTKSKIARHRKKLGHIVGRMEPMWILGMVYCIVFAVSYLAFGAHPYRYILFFTYSMFYPTSGVVFLRFVYNKQHYSSSLDANGNSKSNNLTAPVDSQIQVTSAGNVRFSSKDSDVVSQNQVQSNVVVPSENPTE